ncbi:MAG TPA: efflux RND transporter periplasmic adaptor subunit [Thermoanaerobaculales bacterium]|nr:efflux RND transporter periplasmic adaptor subunit [Thermoanaerobaculales bacterium]HQL30311.1 efflux RND transporter periplasmic adaptor subunit [Thermoanaerobaculales bacterium]
MKTATTVVIAVVALAAAALLVLQGCAPAPPEATKYHCPMHPTYISDRPGDCPICGMRLVPVETRAAPTTVPAFACPMHPEVTSDEPGKCPKCGMDLVPTGEASPSAAISPPPTAEAHTSHVEATGERTVLYYRNPMDPSVTSPTPMKDSMGMDYVPVYAEERPSSAASAVTGLATVDIGPEGLRLAGVQTAPATRERLARTIRAVGTVTADETRIRHVHTKIPGWVEKLDVNFTGQFVTKGEPILSIYSQELLATQEEYLQARETARRFSTSELPEVRKGGDDLVRAARRRLELFDVPDAFLAQLESTGTAQRSVTLEAPVSGFVTVKEVFEGQQVDPSMELFTVTDLSRVWVEADVYEYEAGVLRLGDRATVTLPYDATTRLEGRIAYINPTLNPDTRTLTVRFEFPNSGLTLKPGMFANVELEAESAEGIVIPDSALMDTGQRQVVFVARGNDAFEPREVEVGIRSGGKAQVLSGIAEGEQVVIRANFLLDSESRLRAAIAGMGAGDHQHGAGP